MKLIKMIFISSLLVLSTAVLAQPYTLAPKSLFEIVNWTSQNHRDEITIGNGLGTPILIHIVVNDHGSTSAGISITNCGNTHHINPGSSAICTNADPDNPVTFASDSGTLMATGTYEIKQP